MREAERFADEDKKLKEIVEAKNHAESLAFQCEKTLTDLGDKVTEEERASVTAAVEKLKETAKGNDIDAIKADTEALEKAFYPIAEKLYQAAGAGAGAGAGDADGGDGVYDADFEDKTDK